MQPLASDRFISRWTDNGTYSASSAYRVFFVGMSSLLGAKHIWKAAVPPKVKFFFLLALHGRLWTADRHMRHSLQQSALCALCGQEPETTDHLLLNCVYSRKVWFRLLNSVGRQHWAPNGDETLAVWWQQQRSNAPSALRKSFDSALMLVAWSFWKERNRRVFDGAHRLPHRLHQLVIEEADAWIGAGFSALSVFFVAGDN